MTYQNLSFNKSGIEYKQGKWELDVFLNLPDKKYKPRRLLGTISRGTFYTFRNPSNMLFKKLCGFGFNYSLIKYGDFNFILVDTGGKKYWTARKYLLAKGQILNFKSNQLDRQIFLGISDFGNEKVEQWEKELKRSIETEKKVELNQVKDLQPKNLELIFA